MRRLVPLLSAPAIVFFLACDGEDPNACPPAGLDVCDPVEQRCCDPGEYCTVRYNRGTFGDVCFGGVPEAGDGDPCQPSATGGAAACAGGLVCLQITGVDTEAVCHGLCRSSDDCTSGSCSYDLSGISGVRACVQER